MANKGNYGFSMPGAGGDNNERMGEHLDFDSMSKQELAAYDAREGSYKRLLGDKPITWLWLMNHYSAKNAEAYKRQKDEKKNGNVKKSEPQPGNTGYGRRPEQNPGGRPDAPENIGKSSIDIYPIPPTGQGTTSPTAPTGRSFGKTVALDRSKINQKAKPKSKLDCLGFDQTVDIAVYPFVIGRNGKMVNLCLEDNMAISSVHAEIDYENGEFYILDKGSTNHTFVDDEEIPANVKKSIKEGTKITLADEEFIFHQ